MSTDTSIQLDIINVLEYYANESNYSISDFLPIGCDEGERARDILKRIEDEGI